MSTHPSEVVVDVQFGFERPASPATRAADPASETRPARLPESPHRASRGSRPADDPAGDSSTREGATRVDGRTASDGSVDARDARRLENLDGEAEGDASPDWDPVADATMAKILRSVGHTSTRYGQTRSASVAAGFASAGTEEISMISISASRETEARLRRYPRKSDRGSENRDIEEGHLESDVRALARDARARRAVGNAPVSENAAVGDRDPATKTSSADDLSGRVSAGDLPFSRRLLRSATRAFFPAIARAGSYGTPSTTPTGSDDDGKPPIRLRRTSSYYVFAAEGASRRASFALAPCGVSGVSGVDEAGADDAASALVKEQRARRRREELTRFRRRAADSGKLLASALAGLFAGVALWAMTTATAQLTALKFDATRDLLARAGKATGTDGSSPAALLAAWAFYAGCAALCVGATTAYVLRVAPMARGSGIPELKGYLNGNRQRGLFHWRTFVGRSVGICLVITATMPFGREGPSVHIGACAASAALNAVPWRARLGWQPSPEERRQILQLGSAAGVAAAFNAPIGGLLYVMEEVASSLPPDYVWRAMLAAGTAVGSAQILYAANEGRVDYSSLVISDPDSSTGWSPSDLPLIVLLAVLAGAFSALFTLAADAFGAMRRGGALAKEQEEDEREARRRESPERTEMLQNEDSFSIFRASRRVARGTRAARAATGSTRARGTSVARARGSTP